MPAEKSLNDPLDGEEIKTIILQRISDAMDRDCTLVNDVAYPGFDLKFVITIGFVRSNGQKTEVWGEHAIGTVIPDGPTEIVTGEYQTDSPNTAREDHDMPIPVMIQTPNGPQRVKRKVGRPKKVKE